ncbi:DUF5983 family protein [Enterobacteriaceae bacterium H11S18]|uniref:DUF5983 family protein n=1 Tax=Dryocola clanedunensis TaxID=2925396 RepID=UPI0022F0CF02|nr:DUF5983 family protein [Dryocola clanedunensis]MCT4709169.1 DUF5983 family protein [Dryocola clanedunensis]
MKEFKGVIISTLHMTESDMQLLRRFSSGARDDSLRSEWIYETDYGVIIRMPLFRHARLKLRIIGASELLLSNLSRLYYSQGFSLFYFDVRADVEDSLSCAAW